MSSGTLPANTGRRLAHVAGPSICGCSEPAESVHASSHRMISGLVTLVVAVIRGLVDITVAIVRLIASLIRSMTR
jgi:hypothetical protein